jgi:hypothetical protein
MDSVIAPVRPDVTTVETIPRPTPTPARVPFAEILGGGGVVARAGSGAAWDPSATGSDGLC